eukprot:gene5774-9595_t
MQNIRAKHRLNKILSQIQHNPTNSISDINSKNKEDIRQEEENSTSLGNGVALVVISQLRGSMKYLIEHCNLDEVEVSRLYTYSVISQSVGFFAANNLSKSLGLKRSTLLSALGLALGMASTGLVVSKSKEKRKTLVLLIFTLSILASCSSGVLERTAYNIIVGNYLNHGKLFLSLYVALSTASVTWISIFQNVLIEKFGLPKTYYISAMIIFSSLGLLNLLETNDLFGQKSYNSTPKKRISFDVILQKLLTDIKFFSYVLQFFVVCASRAMLLSKGTSAVEVVAEVSPMKATLISNGIGSIIPVLVRILFASKLRNSTLIGLTSSLFGLQMLTLMGMILFSNNSYLFSASMIGYCSSISLIHPLTHVFKGSLEEVDRKAFNEIQTFITILGSSIPIFTSWITKKMKSKGKEPYKTTFIIHLIFNFLAAWFNLLA